MIRILFQGDSITDAQRDKKHESDFGYMICDFDKKSKDVVSNGSKITFVNASILNGTKNEPTGVRYDTFLEGKFCICKNPCREGVFPPGEEQPALMPPVLQRWCQCLLPVRVGTT